jgi:hypothetical protein
MNALGSWMVRSWSRPDQFMRSLHKIMRGNEMDDRRMLIDLKDMLREKTKKIEWLNSENE